MQETLKRKEKQCKKYNNSKSCMQSNRKKQELKLKQENYIIQPKDYYQKS